jgi:hypothetical protein
MRTLAGVLLALGRLRFRRHQTYPAVPQYRCKEEAHISTSVAQRCKTPPAERCQASLARELLVPNHLSVVRSGSTNGAATNAVARVMNGGP